MKAAIVLLTVTVICGSQSPTEAQEKTQGSSTPAVSPQVRPALPQEQLPALEESASPATREADEAPRKVHAQEEQGLAWETRSQGYWLDPATKLMWEGRDNGMAVTWHKAESYCRGLRVAGYSDWRLATLDELASLVEKRATSLDRVADIEDLAINIGNVSPHVRGGLSLTGNPWSSIREINRFGKPYGDGWFFDFVTSRPSGDLPYFRNTKYALCVRRP
jgi:hypothetical protein